MKLKTQVIFYSKIRKYLYRILLSNVGSSPHKSRHAAFVSTVSGPHSGRRHATLAYAVVSPHSGGHATLVNATLSPHSRSVGFRVVGLLSLSMLP